MDVDQSNWDPRLKEKFAKMTKEEQEAWLAKGKNGASRRARRQKMRQEMQFPQSTTVPTPSQPQIHPQSQTFHGTKTRSSSVPRKDNFRKNAETQLDLGQIEKEMKTLTDKPQQRFQSPPKPVPEQKPVNQKKSFCKPWFTPSLDPDGKEVVVPLKYPPSHQKPKLSDPKPELDPKTKEKQHKQKKKPQKRGDFTYTPVDTHPPKYDSKDQRVAYYEPDPANTPIPAKPKRKPRVLIPEDLTLTDELARKVVALENQRRSIDRVPWPRKWLLDMNIRSIEHQVSSIQAEIAEMETKLQMAKTEKSSLKKTISKTVFQLKSLNRQTSDLNTSISQMDAEVSALNKALSVLRCQHEEMARKCDIHSVKSRKDIIAKMAEENEVNSYSNLELKKRIAFMNKLRRENEVKYKEMDDNEIEQEELNERKRILREQLEGLRKERSELRVKITALEKGLRESDDKAEMTSEDLTHLAAEIEAKKEEVIEKKRNASVMIEQYFKALDKYNEQTVQLDSINEELKKTFKVMK